jgi:hypothetical protein
MQNKLTMEILVMSKYKNLFGAVLSTLLFSGAVVADGVTNDADGDIISGHSADHKDPVLVNPRKAQAPEMGHMGEQNKEDMMHQINDHQEKINVTAGSPPDQHHASSDDSPDAIHETVDHK